MPLLEAGQEAPDFEAVDQHRQPVRLRDHRGRPVVLFFYPADDTPGCTAEACSFRDDWAAWQEAGAEVLGVSVQGVTSHRRFAEKHGLPFRLVADKDKRISEAYGTKGFLGASRRATFLIDAGGRIVRVWPRGGTSGHSAEVLEAVRALVAA